MNLLSNDLLIITLQRTVEEVEEISEERRMVESNGLVLVLNDTFYLLIITNPELNFYIGIEVMVGESEDLSRWLLTN